MILKVVIGVVHQNWFYLISVTAVAKEATSQHSTEFGQSSKLKRPTTLCTDVCGQLFTYTSDHWETQYGLKYFQTCFDL